MKNSWGGIQFKGNKIWHHNKNRYQPKKSYFRFGSLSFLSAVVFGALLSGENIHHDGHDVFVNAKQPHQVRMLEEHSIIHQLPKAVRF